MATLRDKLLASAQRQVDKGNLARAIRDYKKLLDAQPDDTRTRLRIGDLQARMGKKEEAIATYEHVARDYADQGFFLKAVAILKQILRLDPARTDVQVRLADLYLKLNLLSDCMAQYRKVADTFSEAGDLQRYVDVLRRMAVIDPEDVRVQITLAEHFAELGNAPDAAEHFRGAAEGLLRQERWDEYVKVAERYIFHQQDDLTAIKELVRIYLDRRDYKRALAKLQLAFKLDSADVESLDLLARSFLGLGRQEKALRVLKELAEILLADDRDDEALDVYQRVLDIEPYDLDARIHLGLSMPSGIPSMEAAEEARPEAPTELRLEGSKPIHLTDLPTDAGDQWRRLKAQSGLFATPTGLFTCNSAVSEAALEEIGRLIVEIDGFEKLGLIERARAALKRIFELDPLNISAMERAVRIDLARGNVEGAIQRLLRMTRLCWRPDPVRAAGYLNDALKHDPDHPSAMQLRGELGLDGIDLETFMLETSGAEVIEVGDISGLGDSVIPSRVDPSDHDFVYEVVGTMGADAHEDVYIQIDEDDLARPEEAGYIGPPYDEVEDLDEVVEIDDEDFGDELYEPISPSAATRPAWSGGFSPPAGSMPREAPAIVEVDDLEIHDIDVDDDLGIADDDLFLEPDEPQLIEELADTDDSGLRVPEPARHVPAPRAPEPDPAELLSAALSAEARPLPRREASSVSGPAARPPGTTIPRPSPAASAPRVPERRPADPWAAQPPPRQPFPTPPEATRTPTPPPPVAPLVPEPRQPAVMRGTPGSVHTPADPFPTVAEVEDEGLTPLPEGLPDALRDELEELAFFMKAGMRDEAQTLMFDLTTEHPEHTVLIMERMAELESLATRVEE